MQGIDRRTLLAAAATWPWPAAAAGTELSFAVWRKGERIGRHRISLMRQGESVAAAIDVELTVRLLGLPIYRYRHHAQERREGPRLVAFEARTDDDGRVTWLNGAAEPAGFRLRTHEGEALLPPTVTASTWWDEAALGRRPWLNAQSGRLAEVEVRRMGNEAVARGAGQAMARHYRVDGDIRCEVWYAEADGAWLKCRFFSRRSGSDIDYVRD